MDESIRLANKKFNELLADEEAFHDYQMRQLAVMELEGELNHSKVEGIKEGKNEEKIDTAINLLKEGLDLNFISKVTKLLFQSFKH
ncbi:MAG: hypothetical protein LBC39_01015 [Methanobrevibacter sp.]|nr:hypothetical protein [Candidatus Methanovirga aequatorialis]